MNCVNCGTTLTENDSEDILVGPEGNQYGPCCNACWGSARICDSCSSIFTLTSEGAISGEHGHLCPPCASSSSVCSNCGRIGNEQHLIDIGSNQRICATCKDSDYFLCSCGKYHKKGDAIENNVKLRLRFPGLWKSYRLEQGTTPKLTCCDCFIGMRTTHKEYRVFTCKSCGCDSNHVTALSDGDGNHLDYCKSCEGMVFQCAECNDHHTSGTFIHSIDGKVCSNCMVNYRYCGSCDTYVHRDVFNQTEDYCNDCFSRMVQCEACGTHSVNSTTIGSKRVCLDCARKAGKCDVCGSTVLKLYTYENAGGKYCRKCASSRLLGRTESYSFKPYPVMHGKAADLFMGFENEISVIAGASVPINIAKVLSHFSEEQLYIKSDSSVSHGFEEVSHPFTFEELKKVNWEYLFTQQTTKHSSCGLHVHLNRSAFTTLHMYKFINFIHNNEKSIDKLAGRKSNHYSRSLQYTPKEGAKIKQGWDRYNKVNLNTKHTIELRFFAGCNDLYHLMYRLEFCHALYIFSKNNSEKDMSFDSFVSFVKKAQKDYPHLDDYFSA